MLLPVGRLLLDGIGDSHDLIIKLKHEVQLRCFSIMWNSLISRLIRFLLVSVDQVLCGQHVSRIQEGIILHQRTSQTGLACSSHHQISAEGPDIIGSCHHILGQFGAFKGQLLSRQLHPALMLYDLMGRQQMSLDHLRELLNLLAGIIQSIAQASQCRHHFLILLRIGQILSLH